MNYRPLLKSIALLIITWMIFFIAKTTFKNHSDAHLSIIPSNADAVLVLNSNAVSNKLFYQRLFHEDSYRELVSVDEELQNELLSDAIGSGVDILGTIALFSYSSGDYPILGFTVYTEDDEQFESFIERYAERLDVSENIVFGVKGNSGVILYSDSVNHTALHAELNKLIGGAYKSATDQPWFKPLRHKTSDLAIYFDPRKTTDSHYTKFLRMVTPEVIEHSYTYVSMDDGKLSFTHETEAAVEIQRLLRPHTKGGYDNSGGLNLDVSVFLETYNQYAENPLDGILHIRKPDSLIDLHLDSLLTGEIAMRFDGIKFDLGSNTENGIPFNVFAEMFIGVNHDYWHSMRDSLVDANIITLEDGIYRLPLKPYLDERSRVVLNIVERNDKLLLSVDVRQARSPFFDENIVHKDGDLLTFDTDMFVENIRYPLSPDMSKLKDVTGGYMRIESYEGKKLVLEGSIMFKRANHSLIEALHIITNSDDYLTPIETMLKHVSASDL